MDGWTDWPNCFQAYEERVTERMALSGICFSFVSCSLAWGRAEGSKLPSADDLAWWLSSSSTHHSPVRCDGAGDGDWIVLISLVLEHFSPLWKLFPRLLFVNFPWVTFWSRLLLFNSALPTVQSLVAHGVLPWLRVMWYHPWCLSELRAICRERTSCAAPCCCLI